MPFTLLTVGILCSRYFGRRFRQLGFVTNFYEMMSGGNYESQSVPHLLIHTWSLALEVHYYILWGLAAWGISKISKSVAQFRGLIWLQLLCFCSVSLAMFIWRLFQQELLQYEPSLTHVFSFFAGTVLATFQESECMFRWRDWKKRPKSSKSWSL